MRAATLALFGLLVTVSAVVPNYVKNVDLDVVNNSTCTYKSSPVKMNGTNFANNFDFYTGADPTHGFVEYLDYYNAAKWGLYKVNSDGSVYIGVDHENPKPNGRASVRITSKQAFGLGLLVVDLAHMPAQSCGAWPSMWTVGPNWPSGGEIDIIEYVNRNPRNLMSLHTDPDCRIVYPANGQSSVPKGDNCAVAVTAAGCGVEGNTDSTIGSGFNAAGGGVYVMERTTNHIKIWSFLKNSKYPASLLTDKPNPCEFGLPTAYFPMGATCRSNKFGLQNLIIDTTFCGDWADAKGLYNSGGCPSTCVDYVANNPHAFDEAYWKINSVKFFSA